MVRTPVLESLPLAFCTVYACFVAKSQKGINVLWWAGSSQRWAGQTIVGQGGLWEYTSSNHLPQSFQAPYICDLWYLKLYCTWFWCLAFGILEMAFGIL